MNRVAVVSAYGLGDALLSMILSYNLQLSGNRVTTFSSILCEMKEWFPGFTVVPYPCPEHFAETFSSYDQVIAADHSLINETHRFGNHIIILKECHFDKSRTMVDNLQRVCSIRLGLPYAKKENGLIAPPKLNWRSQPDRVVIHPMSSNPKKNWPAEKFLRLAKRLTKEGLNPIFCVSPSERNQWKKIVPENQLPLFSRVHDLACYIYESGSMIGNDSGVGHLAGLLNIPTLSLFARKSYSLLWRPGWGSGNVVTPPSFLPGIHLKQKYWKTLLTVNKVYHAYQKMGAER